MSKVQSLSHKMKTAVHGIERSTMFLLLFAAAALALSKPGGKTKLLDHQHDGAFIKPS